MNLLGSKEGHHSASGTDYKGREIPPPVFAVVDETFAKYHDDHGNGADQHANADWPARRAELFKNRTAKSQQV